MLLEPLLRLERIVQPLEEVGVVERVGDRLGRLRVDLGQLLAPHLDHVRNAARRVCAGHEGRLRRTARVEQQLQALLRLATEEEADEGDVELALLPRELGELVEVLRVAARRVEQQQPRQVLRAHEALLGQRELARVEGEVAQLLPLGLGRLLRRDLVRHLQLAQLHGELELVLWVGRDGERLLLEALRLEEPRDPVVLIARHRRQDGGGRLEVSPHDGRLVLDDGQQQLEAHDRRLAVDHVQPVVLGQVTHNVHRPVEVLHRDHLVAHGVVEPARGVGVDEAVAHPDEGPQLLGHLVHERERLLDALLADGSFRLEGGGDELAMRSPLSDHLISLAATSMRRTSRVSAKSKKSITSPERTPSSPPPKI
eukprot:7376058-Prymnesium_polylepis.1